MKFSVVLPTVGRPSVFAAVKSVIDQSYNNWELTIVHDGGGNDFPQDPRILEIYYRDMPAHNDSGAWARNLAISRGQADWIAYIDDDDVWLPNHLTVLEKCATLHPEANMLRTFGQSFSWRHKSPRSSKLVRKLGPINSQDILTVGMAHTRELFNKTTGWQPVDNHDHLLWREMLATGGVPAIAHEVTFEFER